MRQKRSRKSRYHPVEIPTVDAVPSSAPSNERKATLNANLGVLLVRMQSPKARRGMEAAFDLSSAQLGRAAVNALRRAAKVSEGARVKSSRKRPSKLSKELAELRAARRLARQKPELHPVDLDAPVKRSRKRRASEMAQKK